MSYLVLHGFGRSGVCRLLLGASLTVQTNQVAALDNIIDEIDIISTTSASVAIKDQLNLAGAASKDKALVRQLITWINVHTSYTHPANEIPVVRHVSAKQLKQIAFNKKFSNSLEQKTFKILGLYNFEEKVVYLSDKIDMRTKKGKAVLLHELVHFLQYQYGHDKRVSCKIELEALAYQLEAKYLTAHYQNSLLYNTNVSQWGICIG